jgi:L-threonylcarbamoyladenylate synthase
MDTIQLTGAHLQEAILLLKRGEVIALPSDTVYGLAADLYQEKALLEIFRVKGRPMSKPLIAFIRNLGELEKLVLEPSELFMRLAEQFWPGPLTLVGKRGPGVPLAATAGRETIGVRMPAHALVLQLLEAFGSPLASTSANLSSRPSPTTPEEVLRDLAGKIPAIIDGGPSLSGIPSTILSLEEDVPLLLRIGAIDQRAIEEAIGMRIRVIPEIFS